MAQVTNARAVAFAIAERGGSCWGCARYLAPGKGSVLRRKGAPDEDVNTHGVYCDRVCLHDSQRDWRGA